MTDLINSYATWLATQGKQPETIRAYVSRMRAFAAWCEQRDGAFDPQDITPLDLHDWRSYLETVRRQAPLTVNKAIAALKTFWTYLLDCGAVNVDPTKVLHMQSTALTQLTPRWLTRQQQARLLHEIAKRSDTWIRTRDMAATQLMLQGGLRIGEVAALDIGDVDLRRGTITVRSGKGGRYRVVPTNKDVSRAVEVWMEIRGETVNQALLLSKKGKRPLSDRGLEYVLRRYLDAIGLQDVTVHCLRHSFAKNLVDTGTPIQVVAQLAGHESLRTTRRYVTPSEADLRKAVEGISWER